MMKAILDMWYDTPAHSGAPWRGLSDYWTTAFGNCLRKPTQEARNEEQPARTLQQGVNGIPLARQIVPELSHQSTEGRT